MDISHLKTEERAWPPLSQPDRSRVFAQRASFPSTSNMAVGYAGNKGAHSRGPWGLLRAP